MVTDEDSVNAVVSEADFLAKAIYRALCAPTSHVYQKPLVTGDEFNLRDVLIDGTFDIVAVARHLRESMRSDLLELIKELRDLQKAELK